jgi:hypothetical protein
MIVTIFYLPLFIHNHLGTILWIFAAKHQDIKNKNDGLLCKVKI